MKTRAEIYGNEAAALLRIVTMYPGLNMQQLLCFHPGKEEIIKTLLSHLQKQGRIFQTDTGGYFPSGWAAKSDSSLIRAAWVLLDFIGQVEYHAPGDFPVKLIFFANGELYEIVYAASGQEALINHALRDDRSGGRRIILVDNPEDIRRIDCPGISGFCTVDAAGQVHYFKKTGGTRLERKIISHRIGSILDDISRLSNALYAMDTTDIQRYPDNYEVLSTDAALRAEKIACRLRHLIYSSTTIRKGDYLTSAGIVHGIEVVYEDGVLEVTLPGLLPKRKQRQNTEFLLDPFYFSLEQYAKEHPMPHFSDCVVCFTQVYDQCLPTRRIRDYDNLEEKQLLDVLSTFVMADDTGLLCDAYNTAALGEKDCTRISVMEKKRFPAWLAEHENTLKSISDF